MSLDSSSVEESVKYLAVVERAKNIEKSQSILLITGWAYVYAIESSEDELLIFYFKDRQGNHSSIMTGGEDIICRGWAHPHYSRENFMRVAEKYQIGSSEISKLPSEKVESPNTNLLEQEPGINSNSSIEDSREEMRKELINLKRAITKVQKLL